MPALCKIRLINKEGIRYMKQNLNIKAFRDDRTIGVEAEQRDDQSQHANHLALPATIGMAACVGT